MACITKRRGKYVVDYRDGTGRRRWITCKTRKEAEKALEHALGDARRKRRPTVDPKITLEAYASIFLEVIAAVVKASTLKSYSDMFRLHIVPVFGRLRLDQLERGTINRFLAGQLNEGLSRNSVR